MKKTYEPLNMIKNGRYAVLYGKLAPVLQQEILARMAELIEEERDYEDKGNYGHFCNILPTIAVAKRNLQGTVTGIDRWGAEYASFSKRLCEDNAKAEGVAERTVFAQGDALKLDFPDGIFDAVTSNYVYHNIPSRDRHAILLETLRVLKKGGTFAIHDIFSKDKYGDMQSFVKKLKDLGYEHAELISTDNGRFMSPWEAKWMALSGSAVLFGRK